MGIPPFPILTACFSLCFLGHLPIHYLCPVFALESAFGGTHMKALNHFKYWIVRGLVQWKDCDLFIQADVGSDLRAAPVSCVIVSQRLTSPSLYLLVYKEHLFTEPVR